MKIGIDARFYNESGVGRYLRNLIKNLKVLDSKNQYFIFLLPKDFKEFSESKNFTKVLADFSWYSFTEQFNLPKLLDFYKLDLVHFPHFNVPIFYGGKFVVTIHDLIHQHHSMKRATTLSPFAFKIKQIGYRRVFRNAVTRSCQILTPSKYVQSLLTSEWKVNEEKITVTPEAVDDNILSINTRMSPKESYQAIKKFNIEYPYIFYVGNAHPHKNVEGLIKVFLRLKTKYKDLNLVLCGYDHYFWERLKKENQQKNIIYTGFVSDSELVAFYKNAQMFVLPSFEEGFGIPLLEAMACSCPDVSSNSGSLQEVGGKAPLYFNPHNLEDMADKIKQVLNSGQLRKQLIKKGKRRIKLFSWEKLAGQTLEVYKTCG